MARRECLEKWAGNSQEKKIQMISRIQNDVQHH